MVPVIPRRKVDTAYSLRRVHGKQAAGAVRGQIGSRRLTGHVLEDRTAIRGLELFSICRFIKPVGRSFSRVAREHRFRKAR